MLASSADLSMFALPFLVVHSEDTLDTAPSKGDRCNGQFRPKEYSQQIVRGILASDTIKNLDIDLAGQALPLKVFGDRTDETGMAGSECANNDFATFENVSKVDLQNGVTRSTFWLKLLGIAKSTM